MSHNICRQIFSNTLWKPNKQRYGRYMPSTNCREEHSQDPKIRKLKHEIKEIQTQVESLGDSVNQIKDNLDYANVVDITNLTNTVNTLTQNAEEFNTHVKSSDNNFSIDNVNAISKVFEKCLNKLNFTVKLIKQKTNEIKSAKQYASVLRPIFENKYTDNEVSINGYVVLHTIVDLKKIEERIYFFEPYQSVDNTTSIVTDSVLDKQRIEEDFYGSFIVEKDKYPGQDMLYIINWYKWKDSIKVSISICIPDILNPNGPWIRILSGVNLTPIISSITSISLIPESYLVYLKKIQDAFQSYIKSDYNPMLGTIYQFGEDKDFSLLKVVFSKEHPSWTGQLIIKSYIPGSNVDVPNLIFQINTQLNRSYTGMSAGDIVIVQYALGLTYYTGVIKMLRVTGYDGLCYQIQSIDINKIFTDSVKLTGDVSIQGNLNILRYNGEKVISTDNTRKITSFHNKVGINQESHEVNGLLDIDNLTEQTVLDLFDDFVYYAVNSTDIIKVINELQPTFSDSSISGLFEQGSTLFDYTNQCTVFTSPIKNIIHKEEIKTLHTDNYSVTRPDGTIESGIGKSIISNDASFKRIQQIVKEINQMGPEIANVDDPRFMFSFVELLVSSSIQTYIVSIRAIIDKPNNRLIFVMTYLEITDITNDKSTGKPLLNIVNYMSKVHRYMNYVTLLFKDTGINSGFYDAQGNLAIDTDGSIKLQSSVKNNPFFADRLGLLPESYVYAVDYDTRKFLLYEDKLHWNRQRLGELWNSDVNMNDLSKGIGAQRARLYNNAIGASHILTYFLNSFVKISCSNLIKVTINSIERTFVLGSGFYLNSLLDQSLIVHGDNTISGNFFVNDSENSNIFKVDNVKKTITNKYKVGIGIDEPTTMLDVKDTTVTDVLNQINDALKQYTLLHLIAERLRNLGDTSNKNDFSVCIDESYKELNMKQSTDNYTSLYEINMTTMLPDDVLVCSHWLYRHWNGKKVGEIQDSNNIFALDVLKVFWRYVLERIMIYDTSFFLYLYQDVFGWKFSRMLFVQVGSKMYLLRIGTNLQSFGLKLDTNTNLATLFNNGMRKCLTVNKMYIILRNINPINSIESLNELKELNIKYANIQITKFIITLDMSDINRTVYQSVDFNEDMTQVIIEPAIRVQELQDEENFRVKYRIFWSQFNKQAFSNTMKETHFNTLVYEDLYDDYVAGFKCIKKEGNIFTLLCGESRVQDMIKPSLTVEGDAKIIGDLLVSDKNTGKQYLSVDPYRQFVGIGTDDRYINYADMIYSTTTDIYTAKQNLVISNNTYPVTVSQRIQEKKDDTAGPTINPRYFRTFSGLTVKRKSNLYDFNTMVEYGKLLQAEYSEKYPQDTVTHKKYGTDISYELNDNTDRTVELGNVQMMIDKIDDEGRLRGGFGVQVFDVASDPENNTTSTRQRNILYVDNESTLFVNRINLGGKVLSTDENGNLLWNGQKISMS